MISKIKKEHLFINLKKYNAKKIDTTKESMKNFLNINEISNYLDIKQTNEIQIKLLVDGVYHSNSYPNSSTAFTKKELIKYDIYTIDLEDLGYYDYPTVDFLKQKIGYFNLNSYYLSYKEIYKTHLSKVLILIDKEKSFHSKIHFEYFIPNVISIQYGENTIKAYNLWKKVNKMICDIFNIKILEATEEENIRKYLNEINKIPNKYDDIDYYDEYPINNIVIESNYERLEKYKEMFLEKISFKTFIENFNYKIKESWYKKDFSIHCEIKDLMQEITKYKNPQLPNSHTYLWSNIDVPYLNFFFYDLNKKRSFFNPSVFSKYIRPDKMQNNDWFRDRILFLDVKRPIFIYDNRIYKKLNYLIILPINFPEIELERIKTDIKRILQKQNNTIYDYL